MTGSQKVALPRVLHAPVEIAGQAALSVVGLRQLGVEAHQFASHHPMGYDLQPDIVAPSGRARYLAAAARAVSTHDVLHFHYGLSFVRNQLDARLARRLGKRVVVEFHGSDVRMPSIQRRCNPHYAWIEGEDDGVALRRLATWSEIASGHVVLCDWGLHMEVADYFQHIHVVGHRVDTSRYRPCPPVPETHKPVVVHAPTHLAGKGTPALRVAVAALRQEGLDFEYVEVHGKSHRQARDAYRKADLVVDQLCAGTHGMVAVEAWSMAKPVICYLHPDVPKLDPDLPAINATPDTIKDVLADWLCRPRDREELGRASRSYAERVHDVRVVAARLLDVYAQLPQ